MGKATETPRGDVYSDVFGPWIWEIISSVASSSLLTAIIVILTRVDGRPQEEWNLQITLNTLINVLSTLFRACLASTAAEVISQQKWIWFWSAPAPGRPIRHIQSFDAGSRSLLGSLKLLPIVAIRYPLAILPVVILLSSLLIGPFAQQSIRTVYREVPSDFGTASLPASDYMNSSGSFYRTRGSADFIWWSLRPAPRSDLFKSVSISSSNDFAINWTCSTANCDFPVLSPGSDVTHTSLGVCSSCSDVSSLVKQNETNGSPTYTLPDGMRLISFDTQAQLAVSSTGSSDWAAKVMTKEEMTLARWAFINTTVLALALAPGQSDPNGSESPATLVAVTCSLYPCLKSYAAKVRDSKLSELVVDSKPLVPDLGDYAGVDAEEKVLEYRPLGASNDSLAAVQSPCKIGSDIYVPSNASQAPETKRVRLFTSDAAPEYPATLMPESCITRMDRFGHLLIGAIYRKFLNGSCVWDTRQGPFAECGDEWWLAKFWEEKRATPLTISDRFDEMAGAMTNRIRLGFMRPGETLAQVNGMTVRRVAFLHIEWEWLILPMALLALDIAVLACMIVHSIRYRKKEAVWKSNPLPLLYYKSHFAGLEPDGLSVSTGYDPLETASLDQDRLMTSAQLEAVAETVKVRLRRGTNHPDATTVQVVPTEQFDVEAVYCEARSISWGPKLRMKLCENGFAVWCFTSGDTQLVKDYFDRAGVQLPFEDVVSCDTLGVAKSALAAYEPV